MATHALSIMALAAATPANDDSVPDWTNNPLVRRILASFAATPPSMAVLPRHQRWEADDSVYTGFRVECLQILRNSIVEPAFLAAEARCDRVACRILLDAPTVPEAVADAIRIPTLRPIAVVVRDLNPAAWGDAL